MEHSLQQGNAAKLSCGGVDTDAPESLQSSKYTTLITFEVESLIDALSPTVLRTGVFFDLLGSLL